VIVDNVVLVLTGTVVVMVDVDQLGHHHLKGQSAVAIFLVVITVLKDVLVFVEQGTGAELDTGGLVIGALDEEEYGDGIGDEGVGDAEGVGMAEHEVMGVTEVLVVSGTTVV